MTKLNEKTVALSLGSTTAILNAICLIAVVLLPLQAIRAINSVLFHSMDVSAITTKSTTVIGGIIGTILWFFIAMAVGYLFAKVYNGMAKEEE